MAPQWSQAAGSVFPPSMRVLDDGRTHDLTLTGYDKRAVLFFGVYDIAHYIDTGEVTALEPLDVVIDGPIKAISIRFARNLGVELIRKEFKKSIRRNAEDRWLESAAPTITAFLQAIDRDASKGDRLVLFWLPGGRLVAEFNGEPAFEATDTDFAKLIWSIWFGAKPVCDRDKLLERLRSDIDT